MKKLLNTIYVTSENAYLSVDGENVVIQSEDKILGRIPIHTIDGIVTFGYTGASPALMGKCAPALTLLSKSPRGCKSCTYGKVCGNE